VTQVADRITPGKAEREPADALVFFGATGDLALKQVIPALYNMAKKGRLDVPVVGVAFSYWDLQRLQERVRDSLVTYGGGIDDQAALDHLMSLLRYVDADYTDRDSFNRVKAELGEARRPAHYLAIPPALFGRVVSQPTVHSRPAKRCRRI
jgi:glucose-6-phosphate 1-dehydrogenase